MIKFYSEHLNISIKREESGFSLISNDFSTKYSLNSCKSLVTNNSTKTIRKENITGNYDIIIEKKKDFKKYETFRNKFYNRLQNINFENKNEKFIEHKKSDNLSFLNNLKELQRIEQAFNFEINANINNSENKLQETFSNIKYITNSIIIFDWDDTLLCTSHLCPNGIFYENENYELVFKKYQNQFEKLDEAIYNLLKSSIDLAQTYIITNATEDWVQYSSFKFYPKVFTLLSKLCIISARQRYADIFPGQSKVWKIKTFLDLKKFYNSKTITNLLVLGDNPLDIAAGENLASHFEIAFLKIFKFQENPSLEILSEQIEKLHKIFKLNFEVLDNSIILL